MKTRSIGWKLFRRICVAAVAFAFAQEKAVAQDFPATPDAIWQDITPSSAGTSTFSNKVADGDLHVLMIITPQLGSPRVYFIRAPLSNINLEFRADSTIAIMRLTCHDGSACVTVSNNTDHSDMSTTTFFQEAASPAFIGRLRQSYTNLCPMTWCKD
jgi:hypothetical protein